MASKDSFLEAWEYLHRNTNHRDWSKPEEIQRMTDAFNALQDFSDDQIMIGAQRIALSVNGDGKCWFPKPGEWRKAIIEWLGTGMARDGSLYEAGRLAMAIERDVRLNGGHMALPTGEES